MKHIAHIAIAMLLPVVAAAQKYTQAIPPQVSEIRYNNTTRLTWKHSEGAKSVLIVDRDTTVATLKRNVLTILPSVREVEVVFDARTHPITLTCEHGVQRTDLISRQISTPSTQTPPSFWRRRDVALNFAWGFHNWGSEPLGGFSGVDGPASVRTSFNHIHLSVDFPLVGTRHTGLYIGLGLDWDKYKFTTPEITFDPASAAFAEGTTQDCSSRLLTRYVVVPLTLRIDLWHDWHLSLAALPGIHWSGSHTGLRREYETSDREELQKDQSVNQHINPYKLDLRATLTYEWFGLYLQVPTRSTMKAPVQDLYPIRFGIMLTLD